MLFHFIFLPYASCQPHFGDWSRDASRTMLAAMSALLPCNDPPLPLRALMRLVSHLPGLERQQSSDFLTLIRFGSYTMTLCSMAADACFLSFYRANLWHLYHANQLCADQNTPGGSWGGGCASAKQSKWRGNQTDGCGCCQCRGGNRIIDFFLSSLLSYHYGSKNEGDCIFPHSTLRLSIDLSITNSTLISHSSHLIVAFSFPSLAT